MTQIFRFRGNFTGNVQDEDTLLIDNANGDIYVMGQFKPIGSVYRGFGGREFIIASNGFALTKDDRIKVMRRLIEEKKATIHDLRKLQSVNFTYESVDIDKINPGVKKFIEFVKDRHDKFQKNKYSQLEYIKKADAIIVYHYRLENNQKKIVLFDIGLNTLQVYEHNIYYSALFHIGKPYFGREYVRLDGTITTDASLVKENRRLLKEYNL